MINYDRVRAEVSLDNIYYNFTELKKLAGGNAGAMAIIKADGYGHGANRIADRLNDAADAYGVAMIDEAISLREHGVRKLILILGYTPDSYLHMIPEYDISQTVYDYSTAVVLSEQAIKCGKKAKVHIKLDTGMGRIGFPCSDEGIEDIINISKLDGIELEGCFTHFSKADEKSLEYTGIQFDRYMKCVNRLEELGVIFKIRHACNSAAAIQYNKASLDMVRYGIAMYGLYPSNDIDKSLINLKPAMSIRSVISFVKTVPAGSLISYGGTYKTADETVIATIPVGYADGYPRAMSNTGRVIIKGEYAPIIGRICMDQMMVDVTNIPGVCKGDTVTLIGTDGSKCITVEEVADASMSFNYEFICDVGKRVPRVYI